MPEIKTLMHKGTEILVIDYSGAKPEQMIELMRTARQMALDGHWAHVRLLSILGTPNYLTPSYVRHVEAILREMDYAIERNAVVGLTKVQKWILLGINRWYQKGIKPFETIEDALDYLAENQT